MDDLFYATAKGHGYYKVYRDGEYVCSHQAEREATQTCYNLLFRFPESDIKYVHEYEVEVGLTDAGITEAQNYTPAGDAPPTIDSTPDPSGFIDGLAGSYDFSQHVTDNGVSALTYSIDPTLPNGLVLDGATGELTLDGVFRAQGNDTTFTLTIQNDTYQATSSEFNIVISTVGPTVAAFPYAEGFGTETTHGRGGTVVKVTKLTDDGSEGTLRWALTRTYPRIIVFTTSGTIEPTSSIQMTRVNSDCAVFGQTAPGDGICLSGVNIQNAPLFSMGTAGLNEQNAPTDCLFQHLRFRHGSAFRDGSRNFDCLTMRNGAEHIVFDHCSFTWAADETINLYYGGQYDVTFSHCIFGEGMVRTKETDPSDPGAANSWGHNYGPLIGGFRGVSSNLTFHHNLHIHGWHRNIRFSQPNPNDTTGMQVINNVNYNCFSSNNMIYIHEYNDTDVKMRLDIINQYYKEGPDTDSAPPVRVKDSYAQSAPQRAEMQPSFYFVGSTKRTINDASHATNDEDNNYASGMLTNNQTPAMLYTTRGSPLGTQPTNPVTTTSAAQAYQDVVIAQNVGATKPALDSVDARLVADPVDGGGWDAANVVGFYGTGSFPTLSSAVYYAGNTLWTTDDTSGNGLPDYYQEGVLGIDAADNYNPAATYTLGNGYSDIENWIYTL